MQSLKDISQLILKWYDQQGRHDLPWRQHINPYKVWISEIMLQQTQVTTVLPYFQRFMQHFPSIQTLADAPEDDVLHLWTGLGYYARARNLHKTAKIISNEYLGKFPKTVTLLEQLPGIGRSTAGAIVSIAFKQHATILDGNVKRWLTRLFMVEGWPSNTQVANQLWSLTESLTPKKRVNDYNQAIMDLGAMVCTRSKPKCSQCPLQQHCLAHQHDRQIDYPQAKPRKTLPQKSICVLIFYNQQGDILLQKRPPVGIWGSLYSLPECPHDDDIKLWCEKNYACNVDILHTMKSFRHTFSHFHLDITPVQLRIRKWLTTVQETSDILWYNNDLYDKKLARKHGLPAPIKKLLESLTEPSGEIK